jgi:hypothetical protein
MDLLKLGPVSAIIVTLAVPLISVLLLLSQLGAKFSIQLLIKILQAIGLLPTRRPQGMVFNSQTEEPIAFALLTFTSVPRSPDETVIKETVISDVHGLYQGVRLQPGQYILVVAHQNFTFPTVKDRPQYLAVRDFYKGEIFEIKTNSEEMLQLVPMDPKEKSQTKKTWRSRLRLLIARFRFADLIMPLFIFSLIIALFYPSWINWLIVSIYLILFLRRVWIRHRLPKISGQVVTKSGLPIAQAIIRLSMSQTGQPAAMLSSDHEGGFETNLPPDKYQISVTKQKYIWLKAGSPLTLAEIDNRTANAYLRIEMTDVGEEYKI